MAAIVAVSLVVIFAPAGADAPAPGQPDYGHTQCNLNSAGRCTVPHRLGVVPDAILLTANTPDSFNGFTLNTVRDSWTATSFELRAMYNQNTPKTSGTIWFSYVAYPPSSPPPTTTTVPPTTTTTTTTAVPTTTTTTTTPPAPGGYPNVSNTGVPAGTVFAQTVNGNWMVTQNGTSIDAWHITGVLEIAAQNVTITRSQIDGGVQNFRAPNSSYTLTDSTVGPAFGCAWGVTVWGNNYTALRVRSRNMDNGFSTDSGNLTIRDTFSTTCSPDSSAHADGFETCCDINASYPNITLDHNTFDQRSASSATAPIDLAEALHVTNVRVTNNLVAGGAYSMYLENYTAPSPSTPKWVIAGNKFVNGSWAFDAVTTNNTCGNLDWGSGNDWVTVDSNYNITGTVRANEPCTP
jgi:hypothetical protein